MSIEQLTERIKISRISVDTPLVFHIGWMRTGTTFLQGVFEHHADVQLSLKNRFFSYDPHYLLGKDHYKTLIQSDNNYSKIIVDSDENYAMGRFKTHLRENKTQLNYNYKSELSYIHHDIPEMISRMKEVAPNAKIFGVIRKQASWFESVYKHDVYHFGVDKTFDEFYESELGKAYREAANYYAVIKAFQESFGEENVKIMLFEDFVSNQFKFTKELSDFLELKIEVNKVQKLKKNASTSSFFTKLHQKANLLSEINPDQPEKKTYKMLRSAIYRFDQLAKKQGWYIPGQLISNTTRQKIHAEFDGSNRQLGELLTKNAELQQYQYFR